jgi:predicted lipoprotein with Yx(FWY)xxD motif
MKQLQPQNRTPRALLRRAWPLAAIPATALLAGCGGSNASSATSAASSTAAPAQSTASPATENNAAVAVTAKPSKVGSILAAGPKRLTVYVFEADKEGASSCGQSCAAVWPPVRAGGTIVARGGLDVTKLSRITRADGTRQVTYNGHPLYFYARDGDKSDAYGQGIKSFGASWYVLSPSGNKIDKS